MSGVPVPAHPIVEPFGAGAVDPTYIKLPIPVPSQTGILIGAASFQDGFPPATMSDPETEGGVPPFGQDMNGILNMISAYCALLQAGQRAAFDATSAAAFVGYKVGAQLASTVTAGLVWTNVVDGNVNNPDVVPTGWASNIVGLTIDAPAAGTYNDYVLPGAGDFAVDINTAAGNVSITGFVAQRDGQRIYLSCTGANLLNILALNAGSAAAHRVRAPTDLALVLNQTLTLQYVQALTKWLLV